MKKEYIINLNDLTNLRQFTTDALYKISSHIDAIFERQVVDAKSILGLASLSGHNIKVVIYSDNEEELKTFMKICEKYEVK